MELNFDNIMRYCYKVLGILVFKILILPICFPQFQIELLMQFVEVDMFGFVVGMSLMLVDNMMQLTAKDKYL